MLSFVRVIIFVFILTMACSVLGCFDGKTPPSVEHGSCTLSPSAELGAFTRWHCECLPGYALEDPRNYYVFCYNNNETTSARFPVCRKSCLVQEPISTKWVNQKVDTEILHGDTVVERCKYPPPGLKISRILTCKDGYWSPIWLSASCALEICAPTPIISGAHYRCSFSEKMVNDTDVSVSPIGMTRTEQCFEGMVAKYQCNNGFSPINSEAPRGEATCSFGGRWSPVIPPNFGCELTSGANYATSFLYLPFILLSIYMFT